MSLVRTIRTICFPSIGMPRLDGRSLRSFLMVKSNCQSQPPRSIMVYHATRVWTLFKMKKQESLNLLEQISIWINSLTLLTTLICLCLIQMSSTNVLSSWSKLTRHGSHSSMIQGSFILDYATSPPMRLWELRPQVLPRFLECSTQPHLGPRTSPWNALTELQRTGLLATGSTPSVEIWVHLFHMWLMPREMGLMTYCGCSMTMFKKWPFLMYFLFTRTGTESSFYQHLLTMVAFYRIQSETQS